MGFFWLHFFVQTELFWSWCAAHLESFDLLPILKVLMCCPSWKFWCAAQFESFDVLPILKAVLFLTSNSRSPSPRVQTWLPGRTTIFRWTSSVPQTKNYFWFSGNGLRNVHRDPLPDIFWDDIQPGLRVSFQTIFRVVDIAENLFPKNPSTSWHPSVMCNICYMIHIQFKRW